MKISNTIGLINSSIALHAALTTGVHGAGDEHLALFGQASELLSKVVWKDTSQIAHSENNRTTTLNWTDLDLTAFTSAAAKIVLVEALIKIDNITPPATAILSLRKNGTAPSYVMQYRVSSFEGDEPTLLKYASFLVGMDVGQVIEYKIEITGTIQVDYVIYVLGYIE